MKTVTIETTWRARTVVEVPDDFVLSDNLDEVPDDVVEQMTANGAELVDWEAM